MEYMRVIFVSATCSPKQYTEICNKRKYPLLDSSQKFFDMFLRGLAEQPEVKVDCICVPPISHGTYPGWKVKAYKEVQGKITYHSVGFINYPVLKSMTAKRAVKKKLNELLNHCEENTIIVSDPLLLEGTDPVIKVAAKYNEKTVGFLTDLPDFADECDEHGFLKAKLYRYYNQKCNQLLKQFDQYVFLTEAMNETVNTENKPWILMECLVDSLAIPEKTSKKTESVPTVLYAGKLHKQFGLDILAKATEMVKTECMFHIYGDGNYAEELKRRSREQDNLTIHGIVPVQKVVQEEMKSTLLVNPRTSHGAFTRYSFPSKTAEYMLTGVPVVMFKLPGIPDEYDDYLYYAKEETAESFADKINEVLGLSKKELEEKGQQARSFILSQKSNIKQAKRFVEFCLNDGVE